MPKKSLITFIVFMRKNIEFYPNFPIIISLVLIIFGTGLLDLGSVCFAQNPWTKKADMPNEIMAHASCVMDGKLYVIGGVEDFGIEIKNNALKTMYVYDQTSDNWTPKAEMNTGRAHFSACVFNNMILAFGGGRSHYWNPLKSIEEYDPVLDKWSHKTDMPIARMAHTASLVDDKIYIIGGGKDFVPIAEVDVYDPITNTWDTSKTDMLTPRMYLTSVVLNGKIYAIGGIKGLQDNEKPVTTVEEYDPITDKWTPKADMKAPRKFGYACVLNNKAYVIGGKGGAHGDCVTWPWHVEAYDPVSDKWIEGAKTPTRVLGIHSVATLNGEIYVSGGNGYNGERCHKNIVATMHAYNPDLDTLLDTSLWAVIPENIRQQPASFSLHQNYPNPFNPSTTIEFDLPKTSNVTLKIFNILGEEVTTLVSDKLTAGSYSYDWSRPAGMASSVYLYRLEAERFVETMKMVLLR